MPEICLSTKAWRSGAAWYSQQLALAIARSGASIAFVAPAGEPGDREPCHPNLTRVVLPRERTDNPAWLVRRVASARRALVGLASLLRMRVTTRTFIFSIPEPLLFSLPLFALLRLSGASVVLVVHDAVPHDWTLPAPWHRLEQGGWWLAYRTATKLVCLTRATAEILKARYGVDGARISIIPHGAFRIAPLPPVPDTRRLLVFGTVRRNKNVLAAIRAVLALRREGLPVTLAIAGEIQDRDYWSQCVAAMAEAPEAFEVVAGFIDDADLPRLLGQADAVLLPYSEFSSQSGVGVLAGLAGRPAIATRSGGLADLFDLGLSGEVIHGKVTPAAIAAGIRQFYAKPAAEWNVLAQAGRARLERELDWDAIGTAFADLYGPGAAARPLQSIEGS